MRQGRQTSGAPRRPKYILDLVKARHSDLLLAARYLPAPEWTGSPYED